MISVKRSENKVAILGTASTWKEAPFHKPGWEVWGMNEFWYLWGPYATRWFEIHQLPILFREGWKRYKWLTKCKIPVYIAKHYSLIPFSIEYPLDKVSKGFMRQFQCTFCYQIALAVHEGFKTIGLYGIRLPNGSMRERIIEWRGILYWLGVAAGQGIKIEFDSKGKELEHTYLYGIQYWDEVIDAQMQLMRGFYACSKIDGVGGLKFIWKRLNGKLL